tara:strand:+ start:1273 stop:1476 length:204 start_codon:yes stop_codon:yes gene_type:complete
MTFTIKLTKHDGKIQRKNFTDEEALFEFWNNIQDKMCIETFEGSDIWENKSEYKRMECSKKGWDVEE